MAQLGMNPNKAVIKGWKIDFDKSIVSIFSTPIASMHSVNTKEVININI